MSQKGVIGAWRKSPAWVQWVLRIVLIIGAIFCILSHALAQDFCGDKPCRWRNAQSIPPTWPDRMDAKPQFVPSPYPPTPALQVNEFSGSNPIPEPLGTCQFAGDGKTLTDCKIVEGHTLDELMNAIIADHLRERDLYKHDLARVDALISEFRSANASMIDAEEKVLEAKKFLAISKAHEAPGKHHSTAPTGHKSHARRKVRK